MTKVMGPLLLLLLTFGLTNPELSAHFPNADSSFRAREPLNAGVQAFKNGDYAQAIEDFKQSKTLDPSRLIARLYLVTAYASLFIPGIPEENNKRRGGTGRRRIPEGPRHRFAEYLIDRRDRIDRLQHGRNAV
jgi:hypothetical protein